MPDWRSRRKLVLIVDEADKLPEASREALNYLLRQAPQNLRTVIAARPDWRTDLDDLVTYGQCVVVDQRLLRFDIDETLQLVQARAGARIDRGIGARLHVLTEGWPLGLQLALSIVLRGGDASAGVSGMAVLGGEMERPLVTLLLANLADDDRNFLVRTAILDHLHPDLCRVVTADPRRFGSPGAAEPGHAGVCQRRRRRVAAHACRGA